MNVKFHITVSVDENTNGLLPVCYSNVKELKFDVLYRKLSLYLEKDYTGPSLDILQGHNVSCTPYQHCYYDVADIHVEE